MGSALRAFSRGSGLPWPSLPFVPGGPSRSAPVEEGLCQSRDLFEFLQTMIVFAQVLQLPLLSIRGGSLVNDDETEASSSWISN